jgi:aspartate racemase
MKTLGLIGGTTWLSTIDYYKYINQITSDRLGGLECARLILYSLNFGEFMKFVNADDWESAAQFLAAIAVKLERAGADAIVLCANTTHLTAEAVQQSIGIPILHIVDAVAAEIKQHDLKKVGLLGTKFTMEKDFFSGRLNKFDIEALIPNDSGREFIHNSIYEELGKNIFLDKTKQRYLEIIDELRGHGAQGVILGCTEMPLLVKQSDCNIPVFDTTYIHSKYAVDFALSSDS